MKLVNSTVKYFLCVLLALIFSSSLSYLSANPEKAVPIAVQKVFALTSGQKITDAVLTGWIVSLLLIMGIRRMLRGGPQLIPTRGQAILEEILSLLKSIMEPIVGKHMFRYVFPMLIGYFFSY
jgi:F-type H+-transporting ATPase subunit a